MLDEFEPRRPWLIKEPRLCLLARELLPLLTRPVFVLVVREPQAVAASLATRDGIDRADALALWEHYNREAFAASRGWPRVLVDYAELVADPLGSTRRLCADLRALGVEGLTAPDADVVRDWIDAPAPRAGDPQPIPSDSARALWTAIRDRRLLADDAAAAAASAPPRRAGGG